MNWKSHCFDEILMLAPQLYAISAWEWFIPNAGIVIYVRDLDASFEEIPTVKSKKYVTIWEDYWHHSSSKILNILKSLLGLNQRIFARKTQIFKIQSTQAEQFLNAYHLLNACKAKFHLGLSFENELVALASFSKPKKFLHEGKTILSYEWVRFVSKTGITVVGGLSKLIQYFIDLHRPCHLMTYIDCEFSSGENLEKMGLSFESYKPALLFSVDLNQMKRTLILEQNSKKNPLAEGITIHNQGNLKFSAYFT